MPAISETTRIKIKAYLEVFVDHVVEEYKARKLPTLGSPAEYLAQSSTKGQLKPFHAAIIPESFMRLNEFERGFSTTLGTTFEECARLIALEHHKDAFRGYDLKGNVSQAAINEIERQVTIFEHAADSKGHKPSLEQMVDSVLRTQRTDDLEQLVARADLHIQDKDGREYYFEMKSPMPNKGQCLEVTQRILRFHLLRNSRRPTVQAFFAMAYNPYGPARADYKWSFALNYTPFQQTVLIGQEFWNIVGGPTAYEELLGIYQEVGHVKSKHIIEELAFDF